MKNDKLSLQVLKCLRKSVMSPTLKHHMLGLDIETSLQALDEAQLAFALCKRSQGINNTNAYAKELSKYLRSLTGDDYLNLLDKRLNHRQDVTEDVQKRYDSAEKDYSTNCLVIYSGLEPYPNAEGHLLSDVKDMSEFRALIQDLCQIAVSEESSLIDGIENNMFLLEGKPIRTWFDVTSKIFEAFGKVVAQGGEDNYILDVANNCINALTIDFMLSWIYKHIDEEESALYSGNALLKKDKAETQDLEKALDRIMTNGYIITDYADEESVQNRLTDIMLEHLEPEDIGRYLYELNEIVSKKKLTLLSAVNCTEGFARELGYAYKTISGVSDKEIEEFISNCVTRDVGSYSFSHNFDKELLYYKSPTYSFADEYAYMRFCGNNRVEMIIRYQNRKGADKLYFCRGILEKEETKGLISAETSFFNEDDELPEVLNLFDAFSVTAKSTSTFDVVRCGDNGLDCPRKAMCGYVKDKKNPCLCKTFVRKIASVEDYNETGITCFCSYGVWLADILANSLTSLWTIIANQFFLEIFTASMMKHEASGESEPLIMYVGKTSKPTT